MPSNALMRPSGRAGERYHLFPCLGNMVALKTDPSLDQLPDQKCLIFAVLWFIIGSKISSYEDQKEQTLKLEAGVFQAAFCSLLNSDTFLAVQ